MDDYALLETIMTPNRISQVKALEASEEKHRSLIRDLRDRIVRLTVINDRIETLLENPGYTIINGNLVWNSNP
jgi:hypothetical protein